MAVLLFVFHLIVILAAAVAERLGALRYCGRLLPIVVLVPLFGPVSGLILEVHCRRHPEAVHEVEMEKLTIDDFVNKSITVEDEGLGNKEIVPLEEALAVNQSKTRRSLIMDVLYSNPADYTPQLEVARLNDDTEVVHYAVTALAELQKEYDAAVQDICRQLAANEDNPSLWAQYQLVLEEYLESGLLEGSARLAQQHKLRSVLARRIELSPHAEFTLHCKLAETDLALANMDDAKRDIDFLLDHWERNEHGYLYLIDYHTMNCDRAGIDETVRLIEDRDVYLTPKGREKVSYWTAGE